MRRCGKTIDFKGLLDNALKSEIEGLSDSRSGPTADGFPSDEMNAAGPPEQDSLTDDGEAAAEVVLIAV